MERSYWVYILSSIQRTLYVGVCGDLAGRVEAHKNGFSDFTSRYRVTRLVYAERFGEVWEAIAREKQVKRWRRSKKVGLIESANPQWEDLSDGLDREAGE